MILSACGSVLYSTGELEVCDDLNQSTSTCVSELLDEDDIVIHSAKQKHKSFDKSSGWLKSGEYSWLELQTADDNVTVIGMIGALCKRQL